MYLTFYVFHVFDLKKQNMKSMLREAQKFFDFGPHLSCILRFLVVKEKMWGPKMNKKYPTFLVFYFLALFYSLTILVFHTFLTQNPKGGEFPPPKNKKK